MSRQIQPIIPKYVDAKDFPLTQQILRRLTGADAESEQQRIEGRLHHPCCREGVARVSRGHADHIDALRQAPEQICHR